MKFTGGHYPFALKRTESLSSDSGVVLDRDGYEATLADAMRIVEVATELGVELVGYSGENYEVEGLPVVGVDEICLNGAPPEGCEDFIVQRVDTDMAMRMPGRSIYNWCKTGRKAYTGVVQAILIALKRSMSEDVMLRSEGRWGYEWKHGPGCHQGLTGALAGLTECPEDHEDVRGISGRKLYSLAFPHSPEPDDGIFANPIAGTELEGKRFYLPQEMELDVDLPDFYGLPFGIDWWFLQDQAKEVGRTAVPYAARKPTARQSSRTAGRLRRRWLRLRGARRADVQVLLPPSLRRGKADILQVRGRNDYLPQEAGGAEAGNTAVSRDKGFGALAARRSGERNRQLTET